MGMISGSSGTAVRETAEKFINARGRIRAFSEFESKELLKDVGLQVPRGLFVPSAEQLPLYLTLKYPLAAKVSSAKITSKSDVRGVILNIQTYDELSRAVRRLRSIEDAEGVLIEEMAAPGIEVIVGGVIDPQFGPVVMFGFGGVLVELFKDVSFGLAPISYIDAAKLLRRVKGVRLLEGYRGQPPGDTKALQQVIVTVSELMGTGLFREIDLNPVAIYADGGLILDAKILPV